MYIKLIHKIVSRETFIWIVICLYCHIFFYMLIRLYAYMLIRLYTNAHMIYIYTLIHLYFIVLCSHTPILLYKNLAYNINVCWVSHAIYVSIKILVKFCYYVYIYIKTIFFNLIFFYDYFSKILFLLFFTVSVISTTVSPMISIVMFASIISIIISIFFRLWDVSRETFL